MSSTAIGHAAPAAQLTSTAITAQVFALASNPILPCNLTVPGKGALNSKRFTIRAEGNAFIAVGTTGTLKASLLAALTIPATPLTAANWTTLGGGTARAIAAPGYTPWWIEANLIYDSNGGLLQGTFEQMVNNLFDARAAITSTISGINGTNLTVTQGSTPVPPADPVLQLAVALTFGVTGANLGNLANFELGF